MTFSRRLIWFGWFLGTGLILLSWARIVTPMVGWAGFAISAIASVASRGGSNNADGLVRDYAREVDDLTEAELRDRIDVLTRRLDSGKGHAAQLLYDRASCHQELNEWDESIDDFTGAIDADPRYARAARMGRGIAHLHLEEFEQAVDDLGFGIAHLRQSDDEGHLPDYLYLRAVAEIELRDSEAALCDLNEAIDSGCDNVQARYCRYQARFHLEDYEGALSDAECARDMNSDDHLGWSAIAYIRGCCPDDHFRDGDEAIRCAQRACEITEWQDWMALGALAAAWAEARDFEQAIGFAEQSLGLAPESEKTRRHRRLQQYRDGTPFRFDPNEADTKY